MPKHEKPADKNRAIINPIMGKNPKLGPLAVIAGVSPDTDDMVNRLGLEKFLHLPMSRAYYPEKKSGAVAGPVMGAPYAVYVLEQLICWGAKKIIFLGWCGSISKDLPTGSLFVPDCAFVDEGTSIHYTAPEKRTNARSFPDSEMTSMVKQALKNAGHEFFKGSVWTTDAVFRETREKIEIFSQKGAVAVDMELSALQTVAAWRGVELCSLLVVSDELHTGTWKPGFIDPRFQKARKNAIEVVCNLCRQT